eukprot:2083-Eustigmatos_ZCMA.PRE.1
MVPPSANAASASVDHDVDDAQGDDHASGVAVGHACGGRRQGTATIMHIPAWRYGVKYAAMDISYRR